MDYLNNLKSYVHVKGYICIYVCVGLYFSVIQGPFLQILIQPNYLGLFCCTTFFIF